MRSSMDLLDGLGHSITGSGRSAWGRASRHIPVPALTPSSFISPVISKTPKLHYSCSRQASEARFQPQFGLKSGIKSPLSPVGQAGTATENVVQRNHPSLGGMSGLFMSLGPCTWIFYSPRASCRRVADAWRGSIFTIWEYDYQVLKSLFPTTPPEIWVPHTDGILIMTRGLVWIPSRDCNFAEVMGALVDSWLVELPHDFQAEYGLESCRDLRASHISSFTDISVSELALLMDASPALDQNGAEIPYWKTVDPTLEQKVHWETEARLVFQTPPHFGGEHVAFWEVADRNLAIEVLWTNAISSCDGLVSCMLSGDCDHALLESLAYEGLAKRGHIHGGLLFRDAWARIAANCRLGVWFGRPDWDFDANVLITSVNPGLLDEVLPLAVAGRARKYDHYDEIKWNSRDDNCVCMIDIEAVLARYE